MATITIEISSTDETVLKNDIVNIDTLVQYAVTGKINNCWKRMQKEWTEKLIDDDSFTDPIPSNKDYFINLVTSREDYEDRAARDAKANQTI